MKKELVRLLLFIDRGRGTTRSSVSLLTYRPGGAVDDASADEKRYETERHHPIRKAFPSRSKCHGCISRKDEYSAKHYSAPSL